MELQSSHARQAVSISDMTNTARDDEFEDVPANDRERFQEENAAAAPRQEALVSQLCRQCRQRRVGEEVATIGRRAFVPKCKPP